MREEASRRLDEDFRRLLCEVRAKNGLSPRKLERILRQMDPERIN